jgi:Transglycosylase
MALLNTVRDVLDESVAFVDYASLRLRGQPFVVPSSPANDLWDETQDITTRPPRVWVRSWGWARPVAMAFTAVLCCFVVLTAWSYTNWAELDDLRMRMTAISVTDVDGVDGGALARTNGLTTSNRDKSLSPRITTPVEDVPADFFRAATVLEGQGIAGISPINLARAIACLSFASAGLDDSPFLRLKAGRCAGGSTLLSQAARAVRDERQYGASRKLRENLDTLTLYFHLSSRTERERFISNSLFFGYAEGLPIYGVKGAALAAFGKTPDALELHESALLSAMLLRPLRLRCGDAEDDDVTRFEQQRERALYALDKAFKDDPRFGPTRDALLRMAPLTAPMPATLGLGSVEARCRAGAHPILRFEGLDSSAKLAAQTELRSLEAKGEFVTQVQLSTSFASQTAFKDAIDQARMGIATAQRGHWLIDPNSSAAVVLAFSTNGAGNYSALYESSANAQAQHLRDLGSHAKVPGLAFLAENGWTVDRKFCNRMAASLNNAGGDRGVASCAEGRGAMLVDEVAGRSVSLAMYDALKGYSSRQIADRMRKWGFTIPKGVDPAYGVSFGLLQSTPMHMATFFAAVSNGLAAKPATAQEAAIIARYQTRDGAWHRVPGGRVDLQSVFAVPSARAFLEKAAGAAYSYHGPRGSGTLVSLGKQPAFSLGKSGTLDDTSGHVRLKVAGGAWNGAAWFAMVAPSKGALGDGSIGILNIARPTLDSAGSPASTSGQSPSSDTPIALVGNGNVPPPLAKR